MQILLRPKTRRIITMLIIGLGFGLRLHTLGSESLWYDELLQVNLAQDTIPNLLRRLHPHAALPLDYVITHYWIMLGRSDIWVRLPAVMWGTLALPIAYQVGRRLVSRNVGLLLMVLFMITPFHLRYSQEVRPYALVVVGILLTVYAFWGLRTKWHLSETILLLTGVLIVSLSHYFAIVIFGPLILVNIIDLSRPYKRLTHLKTLLTLFLTGLIALSILIWGLHWGATLVKVTGLFGQTLIEPEKLTAEATEKPNFGEGPDVSWQFIRDEVLGQLGAGTTTTSLILINGLVCLGFINLLWRKKYRLAFFLSIWLILPIVFIITFLVHRGTFFAPRYIILVLPAYLILLVLGINSPLYWSKYVKSPWLTLSLGAILFGLVCGDFGLDIHRLYTTKNKEDWHRAITFIATNAGPNDTVMGIKAEPMVNWYYPPATADGNTYDEFEAVQAAVARSERSWIILSLFSSDIDSHLKLWLSETEQGAIQFPIDSIITVYYLGHNIPRNQLLTEVRDFIVPVDHAIYAHLARENRHYPDIAHQYYLLAIENAPDAQVKARYQQNLDAINR